MNITNVRQRVLKKTPSVRHWVLSLFHIRAMMKQLIKQTNEFVVFTFVGKDMCVSDWMDTTIFSIQNFSRERTGLERKNFHAGDAALQRCETPSGSAVTYAGKFKT